MLTRKVDRSIGPFTDGFKQIIAFYGAGSVRNNTAFLDRKKSSDYGLKELILIDTEERFRLV